MSQNLLLCFDWFDCGGVGVSLKSWGIYGKGRADKTRDSGGIYVPSVLPEMREKHFIFYGI